MLKSFKAKLLIVIVIATLASLAMQLNNHTREILTPVLSFMLQDYELEKKIALMWENSKLKADIPVVPVITDSFTSPCENYQIDTTYGWYLNRETKRQEFFPGVNLLVPDNSLVMAVMGGTVLRIEGNSQSRNIIIKHADNLYSRYVGLKEVLVEENAELGKGEVLGKSHDSLYFELRSEDGPLNPVSIFN